MCSIYSNVLTGTMDVFASMISNNQNQVMKFLTSVTIVLSIPTLISGLFGMNVSDVPFSNSPNGFLYLCSIVVLITIFVTFILTKKDMF